MTLLAPQFLYLLWLAPLAAVLTLWALAARRRAVRRLYAGGAGRPWAPMAGAFRGILAAALWALCVLGVVIALARPAHSPQPRQVQRTGRDAVFVIDVSRSMLAQDLKPNRLERAKLMVNDVLDACEGDRVGIVAFAGSPLQACPMTTEYSFARMTLDALGPDSVGRGGTAIGDAIRAALALLKAGADEDGPSGAADIYLLTDGEDHETRPLEAAAEAAGQGVRLVCIGLGSDAGAPVPTDMQHEMTSGRTPSRGGYMEFGGERVQSRRDPRTLRAMADATPGGVFLDVGTGNLDLDRVYRLLRREGAQRQFDSAAQTAWTEVFQLPLGIAVALALAATLVDAGVPARGRLARRRRSRPGLVSAAAVLAGLLVVTAGPAPAHAQTERAHTQTSSALLAEGKAGEALALLEAATSSHPRSAPLAYNRGCAQLALGQTDDAEASFRRADELAALDGPELAARARYNLGLIEAQRAAAMAEQDPTGAMETLARAERWFRNARPGLAGDARAAAGRNIEAAQQAREALRRRLEEQQEQQQDGQSGEQSQSGGGGGEGDEGGGQGQPSGGEGAQQDGQGQQSPESEAAESLADLARQQERAADDSQQAQRDQQASPQQRRQRADELAEQQRELAEKAEAMDQRLDEMAQAQQSQEVRDNAARSRERLDEARRAQARAEEQLRQGDTAGAEQSQRQAAEKLREAAREALGLGDEPGEEGEQEQEGGEAQRQPERAFSATAANILDREAQQRDAIRRFLRSQQRSRTPPVEKDW